MARYANKPSTEVSIDIAASPEAVWDLVTDINLPARFSNEFQGADWIDTDQPALGAQFMGRNKRGETTEWDTTCTVTWFKPLRDFGYAVEDVESPAARWRYTLEPSGGGTRLTMWAEMGPGRSGVSWFIRQHPEQEEEIVAMRLEEWQANMEATLAGIKDLAEAAG
ncbi:MAG: SRPBCC family protein [bacterium]|nr:SRPBCC family protein [bacterium]